MLASSDEGSLLAGSPREPSEPWIRPGCTGASTGEISPVDSPGDAPHVPPVLALLLAVGILVGNRE